MKQKIVSLLLITLISIGADGDIPKVLHLATNATYPPFEYTDPNGKIVGFDVDLVKAVCRQMQVQCTIADIPWSSIIPSLQLGKFDAVFGAMSITKKREKEVSFTHPYYKDAAALVGPIKAQLTISKAGLAGKTIGVLLGSPFGSFLQGKYGDQVNVNYYGSQQVAFLDLDAGRINAVIGDAPLIMNWIKTDGQGRYGLVGKPIYDEKYFGTGYGIAVRKDNPQLLQALNQALAAIQKNGVYQKVVEQYFGMGS